MRSLKTPVSRYLTVAFALIVTLILGVSIYSFYTFEQLISNARLLSHSSEVINQTQSMLSFAIDMETGQRGFVITGDEDFLNPYYKAQDTIEVVLNKLNELTEGKPSKERVKIIKDLMNRQNSWNQMIIALRRESFDRAQTLVTTGTGMMIMDSIRQVILQVQDEERQLTESRSAIVGNQLRQFQAALTGILTLMASLAAMLYILLKTYLKSKAVTIDALNKSNEEIRNLYDQAPCGYLSVDDQLILTNINQTLLTWMGYAQTEVLGKMKYQDLLSDESRVRFERAFKEDFEVYLEKGYVMDLEFDFRRKDGSTFPVLVNSIATFDETGKFLKSRTTVFDNTKRKQAEQSLVLAYDKICDLYDHAPCGYHSLDASGLFVDVNETELRWLGYRREELVGMMRIQEILTDQSKTIFAETFPSFKTSGKINDLELEFVRKDGTTFFVLINATAIYDKEGNFVRSRSTANDHTARKEAEKMASQLLKELEAFTYSVSHDLRAPLRSIIGYANILEEDHGALLNSEGKRTISVISNSARRMGQLIDDLLEFSRLGKLDLIKSNVNMDSLVRELIDEQMSKETGRKVDLNIGALGLVKADTSMIRQVWVNLISNAFKYSRNSEIRKVKVGRMELPDGAKFFIQDSGVGFDMQYKHKLFEVFQRLHGIRDFEGTGVGLAIVRRIIEKHGGQVSAQGVPGKGATFSFSLPN